VRANVAMVAAAGCNSPVSDLLYGRFHSIKVIIFVTALTFERYSEGACNFADLFANIIFTGR
jgi:hypothetical protein